MSAAEEGITDERIIPDIAREIVASIRGTEEGKQQHEALPALMFTADVRDHCGGVTAHAMINWQRRHGFPEPLATRGPCAVWDSVEVRAWYIDWQTRKMPHATRALEAVRLRRGGKVVREIAAELDTNPSTCRRWLKVAHGPMIKV